MLWCVYLGQLPQHRVELSQISEISGAEHYKRWKTAMSNEEHVHTHKNIHFFYSVKFSLSTIESRSHIFFFSLEKNISFNWFRNDKFRLDIVLFFCSELKKAYHKATTETCTVAPTEMQFICTSFKTDEGFHELYFGALYPLHCL